MNLCTYKYTKANVMATSCHYQCIQPADVHAPYIDISVVNLTCAHV